MAKKTKMKKLLFATILLSSINSFAQVRAKHNPRYMQEGIYLKDGGQIAKDYSRCTLVNVSKTMKGFKCLFIADNSDTLIRFSNNRWKVNQCYYVKNTL